MSTSLSSHSGGDRVLLSVRKDQMLYCQGDAAVHWYVVEQGVIRTCRFDADGNRQVTGFHFAGDAFGIDEERHTQTAEAVCSGSVWRYTAVDGDDEANPVRAALHLALEKVRRDMVVLAKRTAPERLAAFIALTSERVGEGDAFAFPMSRTDIADHLGLTIYTVSRTLSQLCEDGVLQLEGPQRCRVADWAALRRLAGDSGSQGG